MKTSRRPLRSAAVEGSRGTVVPVTDGRVTVKLVLRDARAASVRRLERAGLRLVQSGSGWLIGSVAVESLAALVEDRDVVRLELP